MQENNPVSTPEITTPVAAEQPKQSSFLIILLSILLSTSVAIAGFFAYQTQKLVKELTLLKSEQKVVDTSKPTIEPLTTTVPEIDPTTNWKTFKNNKYNFGFKYPDEYTVGQNGMNSDHPELSGGVFAGNHNDKDFPDEPRFTVSVYLPQGDLELSATGFYNKWGNYSVVNYPATSNHIVSPITKTTLNGDEAYTFTISGSYYSDGASEGISANRERKYLWVLHDNNKFIIRADNTNPTDQILSTFKFFK